MYYTELSTRATLRSTLFCSRLLAETLAVGAIAERLANEVTPDNNLAVGGKLLVGTSDASLANEISIQDNVVVGLLSANKNLTVYGNATIGGSCAVGGHAWRPAGDCEWVYIFGRKCSLSFPRPHKVLGGERWC